ncbi:hypothetical protein TTHERM_00264720 (macronuclear) [Tetrahymena thermophila SB210]|uniref:Uncharacterized protein n=1 Tax=Tetrahymena thermophila (strain SB210) TaxID=312017 RepID=Q22U10_TETTS|nr:hypothetical protein TTHERM_00264720 [Tetrahymena thermophila SB210]EAR88877.2 hypothetical protein TTHERM_00264720 [Tetrahymena thermophila SB210]|eukprot:XP_001009122.2 hypothetical protein TTHERM_00264720 [Tetrahymena thermophila SB210]
MNNNVQIKGVLYQSKSAKKMNTSITPRNRDPSNGGGGLSPVHNRSISNMQSNLSIQNDSSKWVQSSQQLNLNHQQSLPIQSSQNQQLGLTSSNSLNQEYNQGSQSGNQAQYFQQQQQPSARQHINQTQYINSILNRSRSPLNKQQSNQQQQGVSPISKSANKYNMSQISQLITPSKSNRLNTEQSTSSTQGNNLTIQQNSNPRYQQAKSPRTINHSLNPNNLSATMSSAYGLNNNNNSSNNSISIYNMVLNDEINNNKQFYQNQQTLRKANQQSHSYHNLQQFLQTNNSGSYNANQNGATNAASITNSSMINITNNGSNNLINNNSFNNQNLNNSSLLIQQQQNQEVRQSSSLIRPPYQGPGDFSNKNNVQTIPISMIQNSSRQDNNTTRMQNQNRMIVGSAASAKQSSINSNNNSSVQKTNYTMYSNCTNCVELEKELELLRSIVKNCSKCQHSYLSNGSINLHNNQNNNQNNDLDQDDNNTSNFNGNNQYMIEKIQNMRLQEQIQQLMRQLDQVSIERDQLKHNQQNISQEVVEKFQKYEAQIKSLQANQQKNDTKLSSYNILKDKLQEFIDNCSQAQNSSGKVTFNSQELLQECLFIKDYISQQHNQMSTLNQRQLILAKSPSQNNNNPQLSNNAFQDKNIGELVNQQLLLEEKESKQNQYQALPSAIKALELVHRLKNIQQINPFLPNQ